MTLVALAIHAVLLMALLQGARPSARAALEAGDERIVWIPSDLAIRPPAASPPTRRPEPARRWPAATSALAPAPRWPAAAPAPEPPAAILVAIEPQQASAAAPSASAASAPPLPLPPLHLALSRQQLRRLEAETAPTLAEAARAQLRASTAPPGGDDAQAETAHADGSRTVRVHGRCFRLVPTLRSRLDPFNHSGESGAGAVVDTQGPGC